MKTLTRRFLTWSLIGAISCVCAVVLFMYTGPGFAKFAGFPLTLLLIVTAFGGALYGGVFLIRWRRWHPDRRNCVGASTQPEAPNRTYYRPFN